jgi:hypothetical protein
VVLGSPVAQRAPAEEQ